MTSAVQCLSRIEWYLPGHFILLHLIITWTISGQGTRATWNEFNTLESMGLRDWASGPIQKMSRTATEDVEDGTGSWEVFFNPALLPDRVATSETAYDCTKHQNRGVSLRMHQ